LGVSLSLENGMMSLERGAETGDENKSGVKTDLVLLILGINEGKMAGSFIRSQIGAPSLQH
jgi:hypothetical protein